MLYSIVGIDRPDSLEARLSVRADHLARLNALRDAGRLILAGPNPAIDSEDPGDAGFTGSIIVAEFESLETAPLRNGETINLRVVPGPVGFADFATGAVPTGPWC